MQKYLSENRDAIVVGVAGNAVTAFLAILIGWLNILPPVQVPVWVIVAALGLPITVWAVRRPRKKLKPVVDESFYVQRVVLDGKRFIKCRFDGTELVFKGEAPFGLEQNEMNNFRITFSGAAGLTAQVLSALHSDPVFRNRVEALFDGKLKGPPEKKA